MSTDAKIWEKQVLISELEEVYALIEVSHSALKLYSVLGLESIETVLYTTYTKIYEIQEKEKEQLKEMKDIKSSEV